MRMSLEVYGIAALLVLVAPFVLERFVRSLPVAPFCPGCRAATCVLGSGDGFWRRLPILAMVTLSECTRCGWRGAMRWRLARRAARRDHG